MKRESCRAILFLNDKLAVIYREKNNRKYYTFPGGGRENNESLTECIVREIQEELGINITPIRETYFYENENSIQHFWLCQSDADSIGNGSGEEYNGDMSRGIYLPTLIDLQVINEINLQPNLIAKQLKIDLKNFGKNLDLNVKNIVE